MKKLGDSSGDIVKDSCEEVTAGHSDELQSPTDRTVSVSAVSDFCGLGEFAGLENNELDSDC